MEKSTQKIVATPCDFFFTPTFSFSHAQNGCYFPFTAGLSALILMPLLDFYKVKPKYEDDI